MEVASATLWNFLENPSQYAGKLMVLAVLSAADRKIIHQYLETAHPKIYKTSAKLRHYPAERILMFVPCLECDKKVLLDTYNEGLTENNEDEWRSGYCQSCGEFRTFDLHEDDWEEVRCVYGNNAILIGQYLRGYAEPAHAERAKVTMEEFESALSRSTIRVVDAPTRRNLKRKDLQAHVDAQ